MQFHAITRGRLRDAHDFFARHQQQWPKGPWSRNYPEAEVREMCHGQKLDLLYIYIITTHTRGSSIHFHKDTVPYYIPLIYSYYFH